MDYSPPGPFRKEAIHYDDAKVLDRTWGQVFLRGIFANWLVTMAAFLSIYSKEVFSKIIPIWFPSMTFTASGGESLKLFPL
jgi:formate/nitrite transporter FocA (FNT family)